MIVEKLQEIANTVQEQLSEEVKRRLGIDSLEDETVKLVIRPVSDEFFDLHLLCKVCNYSVLLSTLPTKAPEVWQETVAMNAASRLKRFYEHRCDIKRAVAV